MRVVTGELSDQSVVTSAVAGADAVVSTLGPSMVRKATGTPLIEGTQNIVDAMKEHGVSRFIGNATPSALDPHETPTFVTCMASFMPRTFKPRAYEEILGMSDIVMNNDLDWTIVRFLAPKHTPKQDQVRVGFFGADKLGFSVSRANVAAFTAAQVDDDTYLRRAPAISK